MPRPASPTRHRPNSPIRPVLIYLVGYFLFGAGYIAYMTFMIAYVRDAGGGAAAQSAFWCLIGFSAFATPWVWRRVLAPDRGGVSTAIILGVNADRRGDAAVRTFHGVARHLGAGVRRLVLRGGGSTTAFVRFNYPPAAWPKAIAAMTIAFGIGQTLGPIVGRRDHRRDGQPVLCAERLGGDAGARGAGPAFQRRLADRKRSVGNGALARAHQQAPKLSMVHASASPPAAPQVSAQLPLNEL